MHYKIELLEESKKDFDKISKYLEEYGYNKDKVMRKIDKDIKNLSFMPRAHKTLLSYQNPNGEYRRIVSGKYIIIYQINKNKINILRIFNQRENYLNQRRFILREKSQKYIVIK